MSKVDESDEKGQWKCGVCLKGRGEKNKMVWYEGSKA